MIYTVTHLIQIVKYLNKFRFNMRGGRKKENFLSRTIRPKMIWCYQNMFLACKFTLKAARKKLCNCSSSVLKIINEYQKIFKNINVLRKLWRQLNILALQNRKVIKRCNRGKFYDGAIDSTLMWYSLFFSTLIS